jgi:hypothetical protein
VDVDSAAIVGTVDVEAAAVRLPRAAVTPFSAVVRRLSGLPAPVAVVSVAVAAAARRRVRVAASGLVVVSDVAGGGTTADLVAARFRTDAGPDVVGRARRCRGGNGSGIEEWGCEESEVGVTSSIIT